MAENSVSKLTPVVQTSPFHFKDHPIRTRVEGDTLWFVAKDVCAALGIDWSGKTLSTIPPAWQGMGKFPTPSGNQQVRVINEPAVYKLAFRSNQPAADEFTNWVASEVLPSIRKTGRYSVTAPSHPAPATGKTYTLPAKPYQRLNTAQMQALRSAHKAWAEEVTYNDRFKAAHTTWLILKGHFGGVTRLDNLPADWFLDLIEFCHEQQEKELARRRARREMPKPRLAPALPPAPRPNYDVPWGDIPQTVSDAARQAAQVALPLNNARHTVIALASLIEQARETLDALRVLSALEVK